MSIMQSSRTLQTKMDSMIYQIEVVFSITSRIVAGTSDEPSDFWERRVHLVEGQQPEVTPGLTRV